MIPPTFRRGFLRIFPAAAYLDDACIHRVWQVWKIALERK